MGMAAVKLALLRQEALEMQQGTAITLDETVSHSVLISTGLELEDQQYVVLYFMSHTELYIYNSRRRLRRDLSMLGQHATHSQQANAQERKNILQRKINSWCAIQRLYVPSLAMLRRQSQTPTEDDPQYTSLWLPSAICGKVSCHPRLYQFEWDLRFAQANDSLRDLRQYLQLRSHLYKYKDRFATGQRANTRSNTMISRVQAYINASGSRYRTARNALLSLAQFVKKGEAWKATIMDLLDADVRGMTVGEEGESEGHRSMSWIWKQ